MFRQLLLAGVLFSSLTLAAYDRPRGPNQDLTRTVDFHRSSEYPLGATGLRGWMYTTNQMTHHSRQILVTAVTDGAPAARVIQVDDVLLGVNGREFEKDARRTMGEALLEAEATGKMTLIRWRPTPGAKPRRGERTEVAIMLPMYRSFADTAPFHCERSRELLDQSLDRLGEMATAGRFGRINECMLALMAGGRPEHLELVKERIYASKWSKPDFFIDVERGGKAAWSTGMNGLVLAEYYLLTGDKYVLPALREHALKASMGQSGGGTWGHAFAWKEHNDGRLHGRLKGYGGLNLAGLPCQLTIELAERCGIRHPEIRDASRRGRAFFASFVGHGSIGYGYHRPSLDHYNNGHNGYSANGKNALANLVFTVAGDRKTSQYYSMLLTSSYDEREYGHAGNTFNQFWGALGVNCGGPDAVQAFHKERRWYHALGRGVDGEILYQQLGGYYGGVTLSLDAARVMMYSLPLRKLIITGRDPDKKLWLNETQVADSVKAGRWHWADYDAMSTAGILAELNCWSPGAREWMAEELGSRQDAIEPLITMLQSKHADERAGACAALGYQRERAAAAVDELIHALSDPAPQVQVAACHSLMRIGKPAYRAIPTFLKVIASLDEPEPLQPVLQAMAYTLSAPAVRTAPLYFVGIIPSMPEGVNPLAEVDRDVLYPALRTMMAARSGRVRDCGMFLLQFLTREDIAVLGSEIYAATRYSAPDMIMFDSPARGRGMAMMAQHQIVDGVDLTMDHLFSRTWGAYWREPHHYTVLQEFGSTATKALPQLRKARWPVYISDKRTVLEATIDAIEQDVREHDVVTMLQLVHREFQRGLKGLASRRARVKYCRSILQEKNNLKAIVALKELVSLVEDNAAEDIAVLLKREGVYLQEKAIELALTLEDTDESSQFWLGALRKSNDEQQIQGLLMLLAVRDRLAVSDVMPFLKNEDEHIRRAAIQALGEMNGEEARALLLNGPGDDLNPRVRIAYEAALTKSLRFCETLPDATNMPEGAAKSYVAALSDLDSSPSVSALMPIAAGEIGALRSLALDGLARSGRKEVYGALDELLRNESEVRRKEDIAMALLEQIICSTGSASDRFEKINRLLEVEELKRPRIRALQELAWLGDIRGAALLEESCRMQGRGAAAIRSAAVGASCELARRTFNANTKAAILHLLKTAAEADVKEELAQDAELLLTEYSSR